MKDFKDRIGSHAMFDDDRYWRFTRDSRIPHGSFDKKMSPDGFIYLACLILIFLELLLGRLL